MENQNHVILEGIRKSFGEKEVLKGASFTFEKGKIYGLLGRNGSGKTTLFNCLSGDLTPEGGQAYLVQGEERKPLLPEDIGYVFATPILPDFLTGYEFLKFSGKYYQNRWARILIAPGLFLQKLTTREPDDSQLEVALTALKAVIPGDRNEGPGEKNLSLAGAN